MRKHLWLVLAAISLCMVSEDAFAQAVRRLSLDDAINQALKLGEEITIAQAGVDVAEGNEKIATSGFLPQISATLGYTRTIQSQYSGLTSGSSSTTTTTTDTSKSGSGSSANSASSLFSNLPFGKANAWSAGLSVTQNIFTGGRLTAQREAAEARKRVADVDLTAAQAQLVLNVTQSYYDAALADQLVTISRDALSQAEEVYKQTELAYKVGEKAEFDALRAKVSRDNQLPQLIQNENARSQAYYRLKQLLNVSLDDSLDLTTRVSDSLGRFATFSDTATDARSSVEQAKETVTASDAAIRIAESARWPQISANARYAPVAYPDGVFPSFSDWHADLTVGVNLSIPIYTGGNITGNIDVAKAQADQAVGRLQQTREAAELDARTTYNDLRAAQANMHATSSTATEAQRAYEIARVRFTSGISTQVELDDARLQEQQARANYARAVRNYQVARAKVALLKDLPVNPAQAAVPSSSAQTSVTQQQSASAPSPTTTTVTGPPVTTPSPTGSPVQ